MSIEKLTFLYYIMSIFYDFSVYIDKWEKCIYFKNYASKMRKFVIYYKRMECFRLLSILCVIG